jgi:ABC-type Mn2+/Zn2+ transport system ATPase subunit
MTVNASALFVSVSDPYIRVNKADVGYKKETIVSGLNFRVGGGQSLALVGVNGSGKSTLLKTLAGLIPVLSGEISIFDHLPGKTPRRIAYLSQFHPSGFVLPLRVIDVVRMGCFARHGLFGKITDVDDALVKESIGRMGISDLIDSPLSSLSGGQQQRVYLAQVLTKRADLLLLDEPTAGLDVGGKERYRRAVEAELGRGASVVLATHDIQEARYCTQAMLLARRVVALGRGCEVITPETVMETFGIFGSIEDSRRALGYTGTPL